jgi:hypothetical protein
MTTPRAGGGRTRISASCVLAVPAFGPWDGRAATPCSLVVELRFPAARGDCPDAPDRSVVERVRCDRAPPYGDQTEGAYRVGESRVQLLERHVWPPTGGSCWWAINISLVRVLVKVERPACALAQAGRLERSLDSSRTRVRRVLVPKSLHQRLVSDPIPARMPPSAHGRPHTPSSRRQSARATARRPG